MSAFDGPLFGAELLVVALLPALWILISGDIIRRVIALQLIGMLLAAQLLLLSVAFGTESFADLGITLALLSAGASVLYARFLERWL